MSNTPSTKNEDAEMEVADALSAKLKEYYANIAKQALPDRLQDLLRQLDDAERGTPAPKP